MFKKDGTGIDPGRIIISVLWGVVIYMLLTCIFTITIKFELIPLNLMKIISKFNLFFACVIGCVRIRKKGRGETFLNCIITSIMIFTLTMAAVILNQNNKIDTAGVIICLLICVIACFLVLMKTSKNSKLHKRKGRRIKTYTERNHLRS